MVVTVMGISGAFLTTSMQTAKAAADKNGFVTRNNIPCDRPVDCSTIPDEVCRASYDPDGEQAKGKEDNCGEILYRPQN